ncbi:(d)CMP kinase [Candidatus Daviesbacteria bacterium]|nr:(d)CMP kinase [Candidatus Daviesbacteria bacterium]
MSTDIITIDGPTSSGKNSVGFLLAQKLNFQYVDTGMIYRAGCVAILKNNIPLSDKDKVLEIYKSLNIEFKSEDSERRLFLDGEDVTDILHSAQVTKIVPIVAAIPEVREVMKGLQRKIGLKENMVMSGRDIGSEIFPDAKYKFFLTADPEVRAKRRFEQLAKKDPGVKFEDVLKDMLDRDEKDTNRKVSPLRVPKGAKLIDTTNLSVEESVDKMLSYMTQSFK